MPDSYEDETQICEQCLKSYPIPWYMNYNFEQRPFQSADGRVWACAAISIPCPLCGASTSLKFPTANVAKEVQLFADESERELGSRWYLSSYAFVGLERDSIASMKNALNKLKVNLAPDLDPTTWPSHITDLMSERKRKKLLRGRTPSSKNVINYIHSFATLVRELANPDFLHVAGGVASITSKSRARDISSHRENVLSAAYISLVDLFLKNNCKPDFCFEARAVNGDDQVEEWIERCIRRLNKTVAMLYVSRSTAIQLPLMARKGADVRLEIADLIAFTTGRYFHSKKISKSPEIDLADFGPMHYHFWSGREIRSFYRTGFPWTEFFGRLVLD